LEERRSDASAGWLQKFVNVANADLLRDNAVIPATFSPDAVQFFIDLKAACLRAAWGRIYASVVIIAFPAA